MRTFKQHILRYLELTQLILVTIYSLLFSIYINRLSTLMETGENSLLEAIIEEGFSKSSFCGMFAFFLFIMQIIIARFPKTQYKGSIKKSINSFLESMTNLLFSSLNKGKWNYCAMIQICSYKNNTRQTEYSYNAAANESVYKSLDIDFGDVGAAFLSEKNDEQKSTYLIKPLSHKKWMDSDEQYKTNVPENLRLIYAIPIHDISNNGKITGILEFNVFSERKDDDSNIPVKILDKLNSQTIVTALASWSIGLSFLINK